MSPLNITQPLGIWSIVATIRWCPIAPKMDIYQSLLKVALFSELLRATRFHCVASGAPIFGNNWNTSLEQSNHEMETSTIDFHLGSTKRSSWPHLSSELWSSIRKHWNLLSDPYLAWASPPFGWCKPNIFLRGCHGQYFSICYPLVI